MEELIETSKMIGGLFWSLIFLEILFFVIIWTLNIKVREGEQSLPEGLIKIKYEQVKRYEILIGNFEKEAKRFGILIGVLLLMVLVLVSLNVIPSVFLAYIALVSIPLPLLFYFLSRIFHQISEYNIKKWGLRKNGLSHSKNLSEIESSKLVKGIIILISQFDFQRPFEGFYFSTLLFKPIKIPVKEVTDSDIRFWKKIIDYVIKLIEKIADIDRSEPIIEIKKNIIKTLIIIGILLIGVDSFLFIDSTGPIKFIFLFLAMYIPIVILVSFFGLYRIKIMTKNILGKEHNKELKIYTQKLIDYLKNLLKEHNLNPKDFPIELRHNDYDNLVYEKKGKNKFTAYINLKGEEP